MNCGRLVRLIALQPNCTEKKQEKQTKVDPQHVGWKINHSDKFECWIYTIWIKVKLNLLR